MLPYLLEYKMIFPLINVVGEERRGKKPYLRFEYQPRTGGSYSPGFRPGAEVGAEPPPALGWGGLCGWERAPWLGKLDGGDFAGGACGTTQCVAGEGVQGNYEACPTILP